MTAAATSRRHCSFAHALTSLALLLFTLFSSCRGSDRVDGRYSFSLTTFDPSGKLGQVERATRAAALGTPVVAVCRSNEIIMACPQALPSPFISDDGTARFCRITKNIAITHSGLSADGRVVVAAAQRMAVEHAYTFDEVIPIESFLEEVSLLFQEYTMKPGSRPFGCTILVAYLPTREEVALGAEAASQLYRIDPSGSVESMRSCAVIGSLQNNADLRESLKNLAGKNESGEDEAALLRTLEHAIGRPTARDEEGRLKSRISFLVASLTRSKGLAVRRESLKSANSTESGTK